MKTKHLIVNLLFAVFGAACSYFLYIETKIDDLNHRIQGLEDDLASCNSERNGLEKDSERQLREIEDNEREITRLEQDIVSKEQRISSIHRDLNFTQQQLLLAQQNSSLESGKQIEILNQEISRLKAERDTAQISLASVLLELNQAETRVQDLSSQLSELQNRVVPDMESKIQNLATELSRTRDLQAKLNMRADIRDIRIDNRRDIIEFDLVLDSEEVIWLRDVWNEPRYTFRPSILNESTQVQYQAAINNFDEFTKPRMDLSEKMTITFPVGNTSLKKYRNGTSGVNLTRGDYISINVYIDEVNGLNVASTYFLLK